MPDRKSFRVYLRGKNLTGIANIMKGINMKKLSLLLAVVVFMAWGCSHSYNSMMVSGVGVDLKGSAKYEILGDTEGTATVKKILMFYLGDDAKLSGSFPANFSPIAGAKTVCEQAAAYKAIQNFEGADQIICPRFKTEMIIEVGPIYAEYTTTVKAKAVKIKK